MLATPLRVGDVLAGHLIWIAARVATAVAAYLIVMAAFGATRSIDTLAVLPAGVLVGMAFAAPLAAFAAHQENEEAFPLVFRLGHHPAVPLLRGVLSDQSAASRSAGGRLRHPVVARRQPVPAADARPVEPGMAAVHVAYLVALTVVGVFAAPRTFPARLRT